MSEIKNYLDLTFDLIVLISLLIAAIAGYRIGFLQSLFKSIGYITGGVIGVFIAANYLSNLDSVLIKVLSSVVIILLSAVITQYILGRIGLLLHKGLLFAPFKYIDSLLGSILAIIKTLIIFYVISSLLQVTQWQPAYEAIDNSIYYSIFKQNLDIYIRYQDKINY